MAPGPDNVVDLRSDTVTRPTDEMRRAMASAEVGDDVYGEDPTVNALEEVFAARVGKDAAVFVPSGTMANQLAIRLLAAPGTAVVAGRRQHVVIYENGAAARNAGVQFAAVDDDDGTIDPADVAWAGEAVAHHHVRPGLVCLENTHMPADGAPWPLARLEEVAGAAAAAGLPVHLDGARLFNAEVATGVTAAAYAAPVTTVMSCLSKGLCAPVGSLLAGPADLIAEARGERQRLGGGMRQAGILAAAGLVALERMVDRLADDHDRARRLAEAVAERWPGGGCDPSRVRTNVVTWRHPHPAALVDHLAREGVLAGTIAPGVVRLVTHHDVDDAGVDRAVKALGRGAVVAELYRDAPARALAVYAHPDDPEISCGATLARWAAAGTEVHVLVCTKGEKGSKDPAVDPEELAGRRAREMAAAGKVLGLAGREQLAFGDGELANSAELRRAIVAAIRRARPDVVVCPDPTATIFGDTYFNHADHRVAGWATLDAVSPAAGNPHYFPDAGPPHAVGVVLLSGTLEPNVWVDVTAGLDAKVDALLCHASQLEGSAEFFRTVLEGRAEAEGRAAGVRYAEGFRRLRL